MAADSLDLRCEVAAPFFCLTSHGICLAPIAMRQYIFPHPSLSESLSSGSAADDCSGEDSVHVRTWSNVVLRLVACCVAVLVPTIILASVFCRLPEPRREWWLGESGPVELASGWGYLLLAVGLLTVAAIRFGKCRTWRGRSTRQEVSRLIGAPLLLAGCSGTLAAREFDWHNAWTTRCVLKTRFYVDPAISAEEKLAASVVLFLIGYLVVVTVRAYRGRFVDQLRRGQKAAILAATGIALLPLSKALDSGPSIFKRFLPNDPTNLRRFLESIEEVMELAIPTLLLTAAVIGLWPRRKPQIADESVETDDQAVVLKMHYPTRRAA